MNIELKPEKLIERQSARLRELADVAGPFVSVYLDDSRDAADAENRLDAEWRGIRRKLESIGADDAEIDRAGAVIMLGEPAVGRQGRGVIVTRDRVLVDRHLTRPPGTALVRVSDYPYLLPLLDLDEALARYVFAAVDHTGAAIAVHTEDAVHSEIVDGEGYPVHKPTTAGWNGYGDFERTTEEAVRMNVRDVAGRLTELFDQFRPDVVFVSGETRARTDVVAALPDRVEQRVSQLHAGPRGGRASESEARVQIETQLQRMRSDSVGSVVEKFDSERASASGRAVDGLAPVCAALCDGNAGLLIVGRLGDTTVVTGNDRRIIAPDADALSCRGEPVRRVVRADEALPFAAIAADAAVVTVGDSLTLIDGVGALLRHG